MTKSELSNLSKLKKEISVEKNRLKELESKAMSCTVQSFERSVANNSVTDKTSIAASIAECRKVVNARLKNCEQEQKRIIGFIQQIPDSYLRQIFTLRYLEDNTWVAVNMKMKRMGSVKSLEMAADRYLKAYNAEHAQEEAAQEEKRKKSEHRKMLAWRRELEKLQKQG